MKRSVLFGFCLFLLLLLMETMKNPYTYSQGRFVSYYTASTAWIKALVVLAFFLLIVLALLSVKWRIRKNVQADDKLFLKNMIYSLVLFLTFFLVILILIKKRRESFQEILKGFFAAQASPAPPSTQVPAAAHADTLLLTTFLLILCLAFVFAIYHRLKKKQMSVARQEIKSATEEESALEKHSDVRRMIIAYYGHACHLLKKKGFESHRHQTPRQFEATIGPPLRHPLSNLTTLFEEARYSHHAIAEGKRNKARKCYEEIRGEIHEDV